MKGKDKGKRWERDAVRILEEYLGGTWKRIPGSGALGTYLEEPGLTGDIIGNLEFVPRNFKLEAKTGYGGHKQMTVKREWFKKIRDEAEQTYSIPGLICKFSGARDVSKYFIAFDLDAFKQLMNFFAEIYEEWENSDG